MEDKVTYTTTESPAPPYFCYVQIEDHAGYVWRIEVPWLPLWRRVLWRVLLGVKFTKKRG